MRAFTYSRDEQFPDTGAEKLAHRVHAAVPIIEITHHADALRVWRPNREINAGVIVDVAQVRAELVVNLPVLPFAEKMQIDFAHDRSIAVGIAHDTFRSVPIGKAKLGSKVAGRLRHRRAKKAIPMNLFRFDWRLRRNLRGSVSGSPIQHDVDLLYVRLKHPDDPIIAEPMGPK